MLLFYEDEPDAMEDQQSFRNARDTHIENVDPLPQYGSYTFIPFLPNPLQSGYTSSSPTASVSTQLQEQGPLTVHAASSWTYCGPLLLPNPACLPPSFHTWSSLTISQPSVLMQRLLPLLHWLQTLLTEAGIQHYWLTTRCTRPTHEYDTPRWHTDGNFFTCDPSEPGPGFAQTSANSCWTMCTTLLGPSTLFMGDNEKALKVLKETKQRS
jgi:hypothetical protein